MNGQTERLNQELEATLRCITASNPASWSCVLPWAEYAHNALTSSATGLSPFEASIGYQPPLFPELETDLDVPSVQHHLQRCQQAWRMTRWALCRSVACQRRYAARCRRAAPTYTRGQKVWLSAQDGVTQAIATLHRALRGGAGHQSVGNQVEVAPVTTDPPDLSFFPRSSRWASVTCALRPFPHLPPDSSTVIPLSRSGVSWTCAGGGGTGSTWWIGRGTALRSIPGCHGP